MLGGIWEIVSSRVGSDDAVGSREGRSRDEAATFIAAVQTDAVPPGWHTPGGWPFVTYGDNRPSREIRYPPAWLAAADRIPNGRAPVALSARYGRPTSCARASMPYGPPGTIGNRRLRTPECRGG